MITGNLHLKNSGGNGVYSISKATIWPDMEYEDPWVWLSIETDNAIERLPDVLNERVAEEMKNYRNTNAMPGAGFSFKADIRTLNKFINTVILIRDGYFEETDTFVACININECDFLKAKETKISFLEFDGSRYLIKITGECKEKNRYDGSMPLTEFELKAWFTIKEEYLA